MFPFYVILYYIPYRNFCEKESAPEWCLQSLPNIYSYVQQKYWYFSILLFNTKRDVGFLSSFTTRKNKLQFILYSIPFSVCSMILLFHFLIKMWKNLFTLGLSNQIIVKKQDSEIVKYENEAYVVPFYFHFLVLFATIQLYANCEVTIFTCNLQMNLDPHKSMCFFPNSLLVFWKTPD